MRLSDELLALSMQFFELRHGGRYITGEQAEQLSWQLSELCEAATRLEERDRREPRPDLRVVK